MNHTTLSYVGVNSLKLYTFRDYEIYVNILFNNMHVHVHFQVLQPPIHHSPFNKAKRFPPERVTVYLMFKWFKVFFEYTNQKGLYLEFGLLSNIFAVC